MNLSLKRRFKALYQFFVLVLIPFNTFALTKQLISADSTINLSVALPLQSNMVVQQNKPLKIWGHIKKGQSVTVTADWLENGVTVKGDASNNFLAIISVPAAKKGDYSKHAIQVTSGNQKVELSNLLIGDLWFCSGQSNMQFAMREVKDAEKAIASANYPNLRVLNVKFNWKDKPSEIFEGKWQECSPASVRDFSAIGYYYAVELQKQLDIPIGAIYSGVGGSVAQAYLPEEVLAGDSLLKATYLDPFYKGDAYKNSDLNKFTFGTTSYPYLIYNGMIYPFHNLSIKGFLWYQGESNRSERESYIQLTGTLIKTWRQRFAQGDLPFYYVQVAPHAYQKMDSTLNDYAFFREAQEQLSNISNTAMVVTMDVGDPQDIHPKNKKPIASRLARVALNRTYNRLDVAYKGPQFHYAEYSKNKTVVHFEPASVAGGLKTSDGKAPKYFFVAGDDQKFHQAEAQIVANTVVLTCKKVKQPVAIRYAFTNYPTTNLENGEGLPAVPFRTDNWTEPNNRATQ
ncbi:sialate O-acetylesterase [Mucilaginibacter hurinus]|uniref:Sialate O-acetylesterase n=1 Tax=Mucilaginibacter hurinus TaxID=2201324 RepID=A0A367GR31_9SPHI|nr:sialate O-acetylesterase [Mucilaginibacter hurinus]RCH55326.1 sialate O-acetylesterase [Mucilaginibacter hurinus]